MAARRRAIKIGAGRLLAPEDNVGSSVRHNTEVWLDETTGEPYLYHSIILTDCDRQIEWSGRGTAGISHQTKKVKRAIAELQRALRNLDKARVVYLDAKAEWRAKQRGKGVAGLSDTKRAARTITVDPSQIVEVR